MKKFLAIIASVALAISVLAFTGCKDDKESNPYVIDGNYKEVTAEEVKTELSKVDLSSAFGDMTADDYKLGFEYSENLSVNMGTKMNLGGTDMDVSLSMSTDANYKLLVTDLENYVFSGNGYANLNGNLTASAGKQSQSTGLSLKTNLYNDSDYIYVDLYEAKGLENFIGVSVSSLKLKAGFSDILDLIGSMGTPDDSDWNDNLTPAEEVIETPDAGIGVIEPDTSFDLEAVFDMLDALKIKVALDTDNGLKAKITFDMESYEAVLAMAEQLVPAEEAPDDSDYGEYLSYLTYLKNVLAVNALKIDIYVAFDANGLFSAAAVDCDLDVTLKTANVPDMPEAITGDYSVKVTGGMLLKTYGGSINLPQGIATDSSYLDAIELLG